MIGAVEDAIVAKITGAALGYKLEQVESYGNQLDGQLPSVIRSFPAVWIVYRGSPRIEEIGASVWKQTSDFALICATRDRRNKGARRGSNAHPGSYQILTDVMAQLAGDDLGLEIEPFQPIRVQALANRADASIYALEMRTAWEVEYVATASDDFTTFHADWDLPPHGNVGAPLPAAENDAEDTVALETE